MTRVKPMWCAKCQRNVLGQQNFFGVNVYCPICGSRTTLPRPKKGK